MVTYDAAGIAQGQRSLAGREGRAAMLWPALPCDQRLPRQVRPAGRAALRALPHRQPNRALPHHRGGPASEGAIAGC